MPLTDAKVRNLKAREKQYKVADFDSLYVVVKPNSSKLWQMKYRLDGREKTLSIGIYPAVSLQQARKLRDEARSMVANGEDPSEAKQEQKRLKREANGHTFERISASFLEKQRKEGKSKATLDKTAYHLKLANRDFGKKPITTITAPMILRTLRRATKGEFHHHSLHGE